jgi:competence protein ComFC
MKTPNLLKRFTEAAGTLFYPPHCAGCGVEVGPREYLCGSCAASARRIAEPFCEKCSQPFDGAISGAFTCANCGERDYHFTCGVACFRSTGTVRDLIHRFKYNGELFLRHPLAGWLAATLDDARVAREPFDFLVPVPLHPARQREREFNQAEVLSRTLGERTGARVSCCLRRVRYTTTQTRLDREERMENLRNAFELGQNHDVRNQRILLVDDVLTTGSTLDECARVLRGAGAASVRAITVARG